MSRLIEEPGHGRIEEGTGRAAEVIDWRNDARAILRSPLRVTLLKPPPEPD